LFQVKEVEGLRKEKLEKLFKKSKGGDSFIIKTASPWKKLLKKLE